RNLTCTAWSVSFAKHKAEAGWCASVKRIKAWRRNTIGAHIPVRPNKQITRPERVRAMLDAARSTPRPDLVRPARAPIPGPTDVGAVRRFVGTRARRKAARCAGIPAHASRRPAVAQHAGRANHARLV